MATITEATRAKVSFENNYRHQLSIAQHIGSVEAAETSDTPGQWFIKVTMRAGSDVYALLEPQWLGVPVRIFETDDPELQWQPESEPEYGGATVKASKMTITGRHRNDFTWGNAPAETYYTWTSGEPMTYTTRAITTYQDYLDAYTVRSGELRTNVDDGDFPF